MNKEDHYKLIAEKVDDYAAARLSGRPTIIEFTGQSLTGVIKELLDMAYPQDKQESGE